MSSISFLDDMDDELSSTRRTLERFPDGKGTWRPHAKSRTIGELASHVADIPGLAAAIILTDEMDALTRPRREPSGTAAELVQRFEASVVQLRAALAKVDDARLKGEWKMHAGGKVLIQRPRRALLRAMFLSHMIHHRAQLGVYFRLLDVPVPSVYGPTADEQFRG